MADEASRKGELVASMPEKGIAAAVAPKPKLAVAQQVAKPQPAKVPEKNEEQSKVVHIVRRLQEETAQRGALKKRPWLLISILTCVAFPTVVAALFYLLMASDRFVSEAHFAIRNSESQTIDALGMLTGLPSSQIVSDSYIVADFVGSRDMVEELERRLPLRAIFANGDFFSRLGSEVSLENLVEYWQDRVDVYFDPAKSTVSVEVQAFTAPDADRIAREIIEIVKNLVNDLSAAARRDAVQFAASEVARAELRVRGAREDILQFRVAHKELDPAQSAEAILGIAAQLEAERSKLSSELASLTGYLSDDAPSVQILKSRIDALAGEISRIQGQISDGTQSGTAAAQSATAEGAPPADAMATVIGEYQELALNQEFAEKAYTAAMVSLENARAEANRSQAYLAMFGQPSVAQEASYPKRWMNISVVFILASILWAIGALGVLTIRDHVR